MLNSWIKLPPSAGGDPLTTVLTGFASTTGVVTSTDTILSALEKLYGNSLAANFTVAQTSSITLTYAAGTLSGVVRISSAAATAGSLKATLTAKADGLHVEVPFAALSTAGALSDTAQTISGTKTFADNVIVSGDLTVNGTHTTVNSERLLVKDPVITVASGTVGAGTPGFPGLIIDRGNLADADLVWDETGDAFVSGLSFVTLTLSSIVGVYTVGEMVRNAQTPQDSGRVKSIVGGTMVVGMRAGAFVTTEPLVGESSGAAAVVDTIVDGSTFVTIPLTASNLSPAGTVAAVFKQKSGTDLQFRKLVQGTGVTLTEGTDGITIDAAGGASLTDTQASAINASILTNF